MIRSRNLMTLLTIGSIMAYIVRDPYLDPRLTNPVPMPTILARVIVALTYKRYGWDWQTRDMRIGDLDYANRNAR